MNSKIKEYFENKENRIKCGITGGRNGVYGGK